MDGTVMESRLSIDPIQKKILRMAFKTTYLLLGNLGIQFILADGAARVFGIECLEGGQLRAPESSAATR